MLGSNPPNVGNERGSVLDGGSPSEAAVFFYTIIIKLIGNLS